eukprot:9513171-Alexandrium_andersonii.AAC.1
MAPASEGGASQEPVRPRRSEAPGRPPCRSRCTQAAHWRRCDPRSMAPSRLTAPAWAGAPAPQK